MDLCVVSRGGFRMVYKRERERDGSREVDSSRLGKVCYLFSLCVCVCVLLGVVSVTVSCDVIWFVFPLW